MIYTKYNGDYQYEVSENDIVLLTVNKAQPVIINEEVPDEIILYDNAVVKITFKNVTGDIELIVGNYIQRVTLENSQATIEVPGLTEGSYYAMYIAWEMQITSV